MTQLLGGPPGFTVRQMAYQLAYKLLKEVSNSGNADVDPRSQALLQRVLGQGNSNMHLLSKSDASPKQH